MIDNQQTSFTLFIICSEEESKFSSFCKITNTARKAGKQIAQMDWLLITGSIKSQICCLLRDFKVGLLLNIWFPQIRKNPLKHLAVWATLWETQGGWLWCHLQQHDFTISPKSMLSSWLPVFWFIHEPSVLPTCQLFVSADLLPTLLSPAPCPGGCYWLHQ